MSGKRWADMTRRERRNHWLTMVWGGLLTAVVGVGLTYGAADRPGRRRPRRRRKGVVRLTRL